MVHKTLSQKNPSQKRAGGLAEGVDPSTTKTKQNKNPKNKN
jgi:hypothetical protein